MGLTTFGNYNIEDTADFTVYIPKTDPHFATSLAVIPLSAYGLLCKRSQRTGCRQAKKSGKERDG